MKIKVFAVIDTNVLENLNIRTNSEKQQNYKNKSKIKAK